MIGREINKSPRIIKTDEEEFLDKVIDIMEVLELLEIVLSDTIEETGNQIRQAFSKKEYQKID